MFEMVSHGIHGKTRKEKIFFATKSTKGHESKNNCFFSDQSFFRVLPWIPWPKSLLDTRSVLQSRSAVGLLPRERGEGLAANGHLVWVAAEVAVGCCGAVHRVQQVQHVGDRIWAQVEVRAYQVDDLVVADLASAEGVQGNGGRLGYTNGVGHLNLALLSQASGHDVLGYVRPSEGARPVTLRGVFAGEGAATVAAIAAVGVYDDFTAGQATVANRAADYELAGWVDVELGVFVQQFRRQRVFDDQLHHRFFQVFLGDVRVVLGRQHHGVDAHHFAVLIAAGDLALGVRAQPRQQAALAGLGLALHQPVREGDRSWHQHVGLVAGIAEHQALVAGALVFRLLAVNALGDVHRLLADNVDDTTGVAVVAHFGGGVADVFDHATHQVFQVYPGTGGDFTANDGHTGFHHGFASYASVRVVGQDGVQNGVRDLVGQFVRMAFRDRLGGENVVVRHSGAPL